MPVVYKDTSIMPVMLQKKSKTYTNYFESNLKVYMKFYDVA